MALATVMALALALALAGRYANDEIRKSRKKVCRVMR
jgi:hypothetical protein